jgi:hypothetical protein
MNQQQQFDPLANTIHESGIRDRSIEKKPQGYVNQSKSAESARIHLKQHQKFYGEFLSMTNKE